MKLLFDQNISFRLVKKLESSFSHVKHISQVGLINAKDREIWDYARLNGYCIVTFDADFAELAILEGPPPYIIWLRTGNISTNQLIELLIDKQELITDFLHDRAHESFACLELS